MKRVPLKIKFAVLSYSVLTIIFCLSSHAAFAQLLPDISQNRNIVLVGDSHLSIAPIENLKFQGTITNFAVSGYTTTDVINILPAIDAKMGDIAILQIGINDIFFGKSIDDTSGNYHSILKTLKSKGLEVIAFAVFPCNDKRYPNLDTAIESLNQSIKKMSSAVGVTFVNITEALTINGRLNPANTDDGIHLNNDGYKLWFQAIEDELKNFPRT